MPTPNSWANKIAIGVIGAVAAAGVLGSVKVYGNQREMEPRLANVEESIRVGTDTRERVIGMEKQVDMIDKDVGEIKKTNEKILEELRRMNGN